MLAGCQTCHSGCDATSCDSAGCDVSKEVVRGQDGSSYHYSPHHESYVDSGYGDYAAYGGDCMYGGCNTGSYGRDRYRNEKDMCDRTHPDHCGFVSVLGGVCKESWALLNVMTAYRWEGGYPEGALHGWRGSWCGPFGKGSYDGTKAKCEPPRNY